MPKIIYYSRPITWLHQRPYLAPGTYFCSWAPVPALFVCIVYVECRPIFMVVMVYRMFYCGQRGFTLYLGYSKASEEHRLYRISVRQTDRTRTNLKQFIFAMNMTGFFRDDLDENSPNCTNIKVL